MTRPAGGAWRVVGAAVQGVSHVRAGKPCQDALVWTETAGGALVAAVADGAGSAAVAEVGSAIAARAAVTAAADRLELDVPRTEPAWKALLQEVLQAARAEVLAQAEQLELPVEDLATTLIVAAVLPDQAAAAQIGDGAAVARLAEEELRALTRPPVGEYINETSFLTSNGLLDRAQFQAIRAPVTGLALLSDGLQMLALKMPPGTPHVPFFQPLFRFVTEVPDLTRAGEQLRSFLQSSRITQRTDDDLTLMVAVLNRR
ncbi:MAG TPA: PP2C family serine/threonine-protein phosphatase [Gemmataceae bacterium]|nr:PP2C family serine/threonine-protein phosphatase [Gemmataceae bacterium]